MEECTPWPTAERPVLDVSPNLSSRVQSEPVFNSPVGRRILIVEDDESLAGFLAS